MVWSYSSLWHNHGTKLPQTLDIRSNHHFLLPWEKDTLKLASMISGIDKEEQQSSGVGEKHKSILVDSIPDGWRDLVVDIIGHLEAQPGVSPAKILAHTAARSLHTRKIPGISSWTDESVCKLLYWEIIAAEKYMKWKNWLTFRREKA